MEPNGLGAGMFSGLVGVENALPPQQQQNPHHLQNHPQMAVPYASLHDTDPHHQHHNQSMKQGYPQYSSVKTKQQQQQSAAVSDDDDDTSDPKKKVSLWQRMKWTATMVRLLIMAVYCIGDEGGSEGTDKKKSSGMLQKKGKWKSVSRAMMEKGFYVSPQQCEDKFNDLNKRYKRVNDILGKGTACRVVENQSLLETMELSPKMKEEVKKLLNSKHLFFREMCAYHNSCGHGNNNAPQQGETGGELSQSQAQVHQQQPQPQQQQQQQQPPQQQQQQRCFHSSEVGNLGGLRMLKVGNGEENDEDSDSDDDESEDDSDEEEDDSGEGGSRGDVGHGHEDMEDENDGRSMRKRARKVRGVGVSEVMMQLSAEVSGVFQDGGRSGWEKKQWMRNRILQLEEQQLSYQSQSYELEKQRLKWARFSSKKEREMERAKLENERRRLQNERMILLIRQKELELMSFQHQQLHHQQQQQHSST
ncbi:putative mediator of RNA polymerase II transcription subunit 26 [Vigna unguiculata]|uniref:Myb/SANT-like DNA-binding domain-containing protein n=1 Tax=Vigna unguiculata TaxID=3917 RepID=A0A4D6N1E5_VIGUN|nr:putative mediator of RNA polymerase II transcription subunit 26 [Vigna unguiculata]QCE05895.1 hypothetical protein DEO72_LG9g904 [Vigna unguiculata]